MAKHYRKSKDLSKVHMRSCKKSSLMGRLILECFGNSVTCMKEHRVIGASQGRLRLNALIRHIVAIVGEAQDVLPETQSDAEIDHQACLTPVGRVDAAA